jgi:hypothetical protein
MFFHGFVYIKSKSYGTFGIFCSVTEFTFSQTSEHFINERNCACKVQHFSTMERNIDVCRTQLRSDMMRTVPGGK